MTDWATWSAEAQSAYLAGMIDCHSHISARRRLPTTANNMVSPKYSVSVSLSMTERAPVEFAAGLIGAAVTIRKPRGPNHRPHFEMNVENARAAKMLRTALPFLIEKRDRAELLLELAILRSQSRAHRSVYLSKDFLAACEAIYLKAQAPAVAGRFGSST